MNVNGPYKGANWQLKYLTEAELPEILPCRFTPGNWSARVLTDPTLSQWDFWSTLFAEEGDSAVWDFCVNENSLPTFLPVNTSVNQYGGYSVIVLPHDYRLWAIFPQGFISDLASPASGGPFHYHFFDCYFRRMPSAETAFIPHQGGQSGGAGAGWRWPQPIQINGEDYIKWTPFASMWDAIQSESAWIASDWFAKLLGECYVWMHPLFLAMLGEQPGDLFNYFWPDWFQYKFSYTSQYVESHQLFQNDIKHYLYYDEGQTNYRMMGFNTAMRRQAYVNARNLMLSAIDIGKLDADMGLFDRYFWVAQKQSNRLVGFLDDIVHPTTWDLYMTGRWIKATSPQTATVITRPPSGGVYPAYLTLLQALSRILKDP